MEKIKVLQLVWKFNTGGAERMVVNFHKYFSRDDEIEVKTLSFTPKGNELLEQELVGDENITYLPTFFGDKIPSVFGKIIRFLFKRKFKQKWLNEQIKRFQPNVVHVHLANLAYSKYGVLKKLPKNVKVIYHLHSMPETIREKWRKVIRKAVKKGVYNPVCVTELQRESAVKLYGIAEDAPIVYNGIHADSFLTASIREEEKESIKKELQIEEGAFVLGCVGRGAPVKNYPLLAETADVLAQKRKVALLIVGDIPTALQNEILQNAGTAQVVFAGLRKDTAKLYRIMDVFALTSFFESSSIVSVEAQLCGTPCVISERISEEVIISDGVVRVSPYAAATEWAAAVEKVEGQRVNVNDVERFDFNACTKRLKKIYQNLVKYD